MSRFDLWYVQWRRFMLGVGAGTQLIFAVGQLFVSSGTAFWFVVHMVVFVMMIVQAKKFPEGT